MNIRGDWSSWPDKLSTMIKKNFIKQVGWARWAMRYGAFQFRKRALRRDIRMRLPTGAAMILPVRHHVAEIYVTRSNIDWGSEALFAEFADKEADFLDIGANVGYYSNYLSPLVRRVYAFEPDPRNLPALRRNASLCGNVSIVEKAVSSRDGPAKLALAKSSSMNTLEPKPNASVIAVEATTVDRFVAGLPQINVGLVKTDIEGHDIHCFKGMGETVRRFQPLILTECGNEPELLDLLRKWDYCTFAFVRDRQNGALRLAELTPKRLQSDWYKMLFLAPPHVSQRLRDRL